MEVPTVWRFVLTNQKGQTTIEYILLVAIVAVGCVVAIFHFGGAVNHSLCNATATLGGSC